MTYLNTTTPLKIKIYSNNAPATPSNAVGVISFDEKSQRIGIRGHWFGQSNADIGEIVTNFPKVLTALTNNHLLTSQTSGDVTTYTAASDIIGDLSSTGVTGAGSDTKVASLLGALQSQITNLGSTYATDTELTTKIAEVNTTISNLTATVGSTTVDTNKHVAVQVVESGGKLTSLTVTESDIASAATLTAVEKKADSAVQSVNGITGPTAVIGAKDINVAQGVTGGVTGNFFNKDNQNDSILDAIQKLDTALNNITGTNLKNINDAITAIKNELKTGEGADLAETLIDKLSSFLNNKTKWTVSTLDDVTNVDNLISTLKAYAETKASDAQTAAAADATSKANTAKTTAIDTVTGTSSDTADKLTLNGLKTKIDGVSGAAIKATTVTDGVTGDAEAGTTNYVVVTGTTATASTAGTFTIKTTKALETELKKIDNLISWEVDPS